MTDTSYGDISTTVNQEERVAFSGNEVEQAVREYFSDIPVLVQVARCESTFRHTLEDGTVLRGKVDSRDLGVMQINTFYHGTEAAKLGLDLENFEDNMEYARQLYERQGTQPWKASSACWNKSLASL
jgi:hypothetical protein